MRIYHILTAVQKGSVSNGHLYLVVQTNYSNNVMQFVSYVDNSSLENILYNVQAQFNNRNLDILTRECEI